MEVKTVILIFIWFICLMIVWTICAMFITAPDTILNLIGGIIGLMFIITTVKTKCFTHKWTSN